MTKPTGTESLGGGGTGHVECRRSAPESKHLGPLPMAGLRGQAEIPRPAFARGYGGQAKLGMTALKDPAG